MFSSRWRTLLREGERYDFHPAKNFTFSFLIFNFIMSYTREELDKMFNELPDDVRDAMSSVDTVNILKGLQEKYKLHIDQIGELSAEIAMLMIGAMPPQRFITNIQKSIGADKETAKTIAAEINEKIFKNVRRSLMEIHQMDEEKNYQDEKAKEEETKTIPPPANPEETKIEPKKPAVADPYKEAV
jgi:hypothetical protein